MVKKKLDAMPNKLISKTKPLDGSTQTTPTEASAPDTKLARKKTATELSGDENRNTAQGVSTRKQRGKTTEMVSENNVCKGNGENPCGKQVLDDDMGGIECDVCLAWYHPVWQGAKDEAYDAVRKNELFWICVQCKKFVSEFRNVVHGKGTTAGQIDAACLGRMERKLDDLSKAVSEQNVKVKEAAADANKAKKLYADALKDGEAKSEQTKNISRESIQTCFEKFQNEKDEKEKRKCNIVISNMTESQASTGEERKVHDIKKLTNIIKEELKIHVRIENAFRAGKRQENKPRLLIATLPSEACKWDVLKAAKMLRDSENTEVKGMYINKDLTVLEREQNKKLRDEVKRRKSEGENVKIIKGKCVVVKEDKSSSVPVSSDQGQMSASNPLQA